MKPPSKSVSQDHKGRDPVSAIQLPIKLTAAIDKWAEENGIKSRSEAIHRLLEFALAALQPLQQRNLEAASKALELAAREIDKLIDPSTADEERKTRKRRLLRGPKEFQDIRGDMSKRNR